VAKDPRSPEERAEWEAGRFTDEEAAAVGDTAANLNRMREEGERDAGNPLAPPPKPETEPMLPYTCSDCGARTGEPHAWNCSTRR
jgi:hypothetical protein